MRRLWLRSEATANWRPYLLRREPQYQDVILPLTVLRRLDCVLADTKEAVLKKQGELKGKIDDLV